MASVRMTQDLRAAIRGKAEEAYHMANPRPKPNNAFIAELRNAIINSPEQIFLREIKKMGEQRGLDKENRQGPDILPYGRNEPVTAIDLRQETTSDNNFPNHVHIQFDTPLTEYLVVKGDRYNWGLESVAIGDLDNSHKVSIYEQYMAFHKTNMDHEIARGAYEKSIRELVNSCTTLKQLLEIWPAAESLVPNDKIQKMHTKVTRVERAAAIKEKVCFDPTVANQTVLTAKMLGG